MPVLHNARMFLTLPTILTWARIVAIPLIVGVFYLPLGDAIVKGSRIPAGNSR